MKTDAEVHLMLRERKHGKTLEQAAARAGMSVPTARKYLRSAKLPSALRHARHYRNVDGSFDLDRPIEAEAFHVANFVAKRKNRGNCGHRQRSDRRFEHHFSA